MQESESEPQERIEVTVCKNGVVNVHRPESDKAHSVFVDGQKAIRCSCKGHKYNGRCTHQDEVEKRPIVLSAASVAQQSKAMTDGGTNDLGTVTGWEPNNHQHDDEEVDTTPL